MLSLAQKKDISEEIKSTIKDNAYIYLVSISDLNASQSHALRTACFNHKVGIKVIKNKIFIKAVQALIMANEEAFPLQEIIERQILKGSTAIMTSPQANTAAKLIKDFRKNHEKPQIKVAFLDGDLYYGDDSLESLISIKSREELIADLVSIVNAPGSSLVRSISSTGSTITACLQAIIEKKEKH